MSKVFDIILPLYSPHDLWCEHICDAVSHIREHFSGQDVAIHVYLTNDGAPLIKYPQEKLERIRKVANGNFHFLSYEKNRGKGYSLRYLVERTSGIYQVYTDGDFPFGWEPVVRAFETLDSGADVVMGKRGQDYNGALCFFRKIISKGARFLNRIFLGLPDDYLDAQAGLKGFNAAGKKAFLKTTVDTFVFDTEFILIAWKNKLKIVPVPIRIRPEIVLSTMGMKVLKKELFCFFRVLWQIRIKRKY